MKQLYKAASMPKSGWLLECMFGQMVPLGSLAAVGGIMSFVWYTPASMMSLRLRTGVTPLASASRSHSALILNDALEKRFKAQHNHCDQGA